MSDERDMGADRDTREAKPCLKRVRRDDGALGFCQLQDGHDRGEDAVGCFTVFLSLAAVACDFGPKAATSTRRGR